MFPSECVLERRVLSGGHRNLAAADLPLFILKCEDRKAEGYADDKLEMYNQRLQRMVIGVRLASKPPAVSYLAILGALRLMANIVALDKSVIVLSLTGEGGPMSYLIYDAVALSLRMIPQPENRYSGYRVSIARPCHGGDYALVHTGILAHEYENDEDACVFVWRPSSSSLPWSEKKMSSFPDGIDWADTEFSFNGHAYWVDLLCGVSYCNCDAIFDDNTSVVESGGFIHLPVELLGYHRNSQQEVPPCAYRAMNVVCDSFIRLVSIDGFKKKKRTMTVWTLLGHDEGWEKEHEFSMEALWGFEGFGNLPKNLAPMYPVLSTKDADVMYLVVGEYRESRFNIKIVPADARYLLAVDMRKKTVTSVPRAHWFPQFVSCGFSRRLRKALVGPCDDQGVAIPMMEDRKGDGENVVEASISMKKRTRKKPRRC